MGIFNFCRNGEDFSKNECYTRNEGYPDFSAKDVNYVTSRFLPNAEHCTIHDWHLSVSSKEWFAKGYQTIYTITLRLVHSSVYYTFSFATLFAIENVWKLGYYAWDKPLLFLEGSFCISQWYREEESGLNAPLLPWVKG